MLFSKSCIGTKTSLKSLDPTLLRLESILLNRGLSRANKKIGR